MGGGDGAASARRQAEAILRRAPLDSSRRASYGEEERSEVVQALWPDGRREALAPRRDDRVSFALRDHFQAAAPPCAEQLRRLTARLGPPEAVTVAYSYRADWEGEPPLRESGRWRFAWAEVAALLDLSS